MKNIIVLSVLAVFSLAVAAQPAEAAIMGTFVPAIASVRVGTKALSKTPSKTAPGGIAKICSVMFDFGSGSDDQIFDRNGDGVYRPGEDIFSFVFGWIRW